MAVVTEMEQISGVMPPPNGTESPKRKGRPPGSRNKPAEVPDEEDSSVDPRLKNQREDIFATIANISDWAYEFAYLYRLSPTIDRRSAGRQINIDKFAAAFDLEDIKKKHGSGCYRICLFHIDPASNKYFKYRDEKIDILDMDYPPNVPAGDWVNEPANEVWKWAAPKLQAAAAQQNGGYPPGFNIKDVYEDAFKIADRMNPKKDTAGENALLVKLAELSDPMRIISLLEKIQPKPEKPDTSATDKLFTMMNDQLKETREELRELRKVQTAPPPAPKGILEQVKELKPVISEFADMFAERTGNTPWWQGPLEKLMDSVPDVIDLVKTGQQNQQRQQPPQWNQNPGLPAPQTQTAAPPPQGPPPNQTAAAAEQPELSDEQKRVQAIYQKWGGFVMFIWPQMIEHFKLDDDGHGGYHFRDWFIRGHGMFKWSDMRKELGPQTLVQMIEQHPVFKQEMLPLAERERFFDEFFEPIQEDDEDEDEPIVLGGEAS